ncbi:MAG TPA: hypothetical protein PLJ08_09670 [Cyclobacteriaceae bacterium]|nr:hypothetical protein [Cyclobacteriaceae bacterium]
MRIASFVVTILLFLQLTSCSRAKNKYVFITRYDDNTGYNGNSSINAMVSKDSLYIFFEHGFDKDTLEIQVEEDLRKLNLSTSAFGLADVQLFGKIENISEFSISMNGSKRHKVEIRDPSMNKWAVKVKHDTIFITVLNNALYYE